MGYWIFKLLQVLFFKRLCGNWELYVRELEEQGIETK